MCGIAGFVSKENTISYINSAINNMIDAVYWRGPDYKGTYTDIFNDYIIGLAHRRLSILDLSSNGNQPMLFNDKQYALIYNGEIYNYKKLKNELILKGHSFKSNCDSEVVLHALIEYGVENACSKFNGMWAFAFFDKKNATISLSIDRMGIKPLYYFKNDKNFVFSSDLRSLYLLKEVPKSINITALQCYLWNMYIPSPYTIINDVFKIESGSILVYNLLDNTITKSKYWNIYDIKSTSSINYNDYVANVEKLLQDAVNIRLEADVPVGVFLSGGIDSSLVSIFAANQLKKRINTFSISFKEKNDDDGKYASQIAKIISSNHTELVCTQSDALDLIEQIPKAYSEPFADNSQIATMLLCKLTKEHVDVALSGDGADELFIGYPTYIDNCKIQTIRNKYNLIINKAYSIVKLLNLSKYNYLSWKINKLYNANSNKNIINLSCITACELINSLFLNANISENEISNLYYGKNEKYNNLNLIETSVLQSIEYGLKDDMLTKVDRASMYYSLEARCPFLDYRIVECALSVPYSYNIKNGVLKSSLRDILSKFVPKEIIYRKKSGFGVPISKWLHSDLTELVNVYTDLYFIKKQNIFDYKGINELVYEFYKQKNPILDRIIYSLLMFQLWWEEYFNY